MSTSLVPTSPQSNPNVITSPTGAVNDARPLRTAFLYTVHPEYRQRYEEWRREERRMAGGDAIMEELERFGWEDGESRHYTIRQARAVYPNLALRHAKTVTGHLAKHRPMPGNGLSMGNLGDVRPRDEISGTPTRGELIWYNVNGVGADGAQLDAWLDDVDIRAQATGHRWIMIEAPSGRATTLLDELNGMRPFAVEYSPLLVTNWKFVNGRLTYAIIRVQTTAQIVNGVPDERWTNRLGYYLLVAKGETALGDEYAEGGWWTFDPDQRFLDHATWDDTFGQIPLFRHYGRMSAGTTERPASSASDTMELGQLGVSIMNTRSARESDFIDACASKIYFLGADAEVMKVVVEGWRESALVAVPPRRNDDGSVAPVTVYDGSTGVVAAQAADSLEKSQWDLAREISISKATSTPDASGQSKNAGFNEASAPDLVRRAVLREQTENTLLYFFELRFGFATPRAYAVWPREFDLQPLVDDIDAMFDTLRRASAESATLEVELLLQSLVERNLITDTAKLNKIKAEFYQTFADQQSQAEADRQILRGAPKSGRPEGVLPAPPTGPVTATPPAPSSSAPTPPSTPTPPTDGRTPPVSSAGSSSGTTHTQSAPPSSPDTSAGPPRNTETPRPHANPVPGSAQPATHESAPSHAGESAPAPHPVAHPEVGRSAAPPTNPDTSSSAIASLTAQVTLLLSQMAALQALILKAQAEDDAEDAAEEDEEDPVLAAIAALGERLAVLEAPEPTPTAPKSDVLVIPMQNGSDLEITVKRDANNLMTGASVTRPGA